jgi:hypothetical protein
VRRALAASFVALAASFVALAGSFVALAASFVALAGSFVALAACGRAAPSESPGLPAPPAVLVAEHVAQAPLVDGRLSEAAWLAAAATPRFVDAATGADEPPHTEARVLWDERALYVGLYAGDVDLEPSDRMGVVLRAPGGRTTVVEADPTGRLLWHAPGGPRLPVPAGVRVAVDADGTIGRPDDDDEEWIVELALPWSALGASGPCDVRANFFRRDLPRGVPLRQLAWIAWRGRATGDLRALGEVRRAPR